MTQQVVSKALAEQLQCQFYAEFGDTCWEGVMNFLDIVLPAVGMGAGLCVQWNAKVPGWNISRNSVISGIGMFRLHQNTRVSGAERQALSVYPHLMESLASQGVATQERIQTSWKYQRGRQWKQYGDAECIAVTNESINRANIVRGLQSMRENPEIQIDKLVDAMTKRNLQGTSLSAVTGQVSYKRQALMSIDISRNDKRETNLKYARQRGNGTSFQSLTRSQLLLNQENKKPAEYTDRGRHRAKN